MRYEYYFCQNETPWLTEFITSQNITYKRTEFTDGTVYIIFSLYSTTPNIDSYLEELKQKRITPSINREYSERDLNNAKLLIIRPYKYFFDIINEDEAVEQLMHTKHRYAPSQSERSQLLTKKLHFGAHPLEDQRFL